MYSGQEKVLIIDDDPLMAKMVEGHLKVAKFKTRYATDGGQGILIARDWDPDLVLLDVMMPGMDGFTTCARLREFSSVPVIILTAKGEERDKVRGLDAGADDYIVKPFSAQELLARVRAVLRRAEQTNFSKFPQRYFRHYDLMIDLARAEVTADEVPVSLTATEYRLLQTLSDSIGKVLSPEELLSRVWGVDYRKEKEILWVTLSRLRQKIEKDPRNPVHIVTRQGLGYLMPSETNESEQGDTADMDQFDPDTRPPAA
ncbi:MAG: response regulator transcription factor [Anaerolineales bacterium]|nr:response regulator transcription factor [Anaerolineales bacterium]